MEGLDSMAIFRDCGQGGRERSSEDRRRHRELVEESIRNNIGGIISEESIIGQSGSKKLKYPSGGSRNIALFSAKTNGERQPVTGMRRGAIS